MRERDKERNREREVARPAPYRERGLSPTPLRERGGERERESERAREREMACGESSDVRRRAKMAHIRQSRPDSGLGFQLKVLKTLEGDQSLLGLL